MFTIRFGAPLNKQDRSRREAKLARIHLIPALILGVVLLGCYGYTDRFFYVWMESIFLDQIPPASGYLSAFAFVFFSFLSFSTVFWFSKAAMSGIAENAATPLSLHFPVFVIAFGGAGLFAFIVAPVALVRLLYHFIFG